MKGKKILRTIIDEASEMLYGGKSWKEYRYLESFYREYGAGKYDFLLRRGAFFPRYMNSIGQSITSAGIGISIWNYFSGEPSTFLIANSVALKSGFYIVSMFTLICEKKMRGKILRIERERNEEVVDDGGEEWKRNTLYDLSDEL